METELLRATPNPEWTILQAARNDYMTEWIGDKTPEQALDESGSETKTEFIERLLERGHFGPTEHVQTTFAVKDISRVCMAQVTRHRHATFDVQSLRYTSPGADEDLTFESVEDMVVVPPSIKEADMGEDFIRECASDFEKYQQYLSAGVPKEDARFTLPLATSVNMVVSMNLRHALHVLDMRHAANAQWEVQNLAKEILEHLKDWVPIVAGYYDNEMSPRKNRLAP